MKYRTKIASSLMFIILIGIISFQGYWIYSIYHMNKQRIYSELNYMLVNTIRELIIKKSLTAIRPTEPFEDEETLLENRKKAIKTMTKVFSSYYSECLGCSPKKDVKTSDSTHLELEKEFINDLSDLDFDFIKNKIFRDIKKYNFKNNVFLGIWNKNEKNFVYSTKDSHVQKNNGITYNLFERIGNNNYELFFKVQNNGIEKKAFLGVNFIILFSFILLIILIILWIYIIKSIKKEEIFSEMKSNFIDNMTHELKTPLTSISMALESISNQMKLDDNEKLLRFLDVIHYEKDRILKISDSIFNANEDIRCEGKRSLIDAGNLIDNVCCAIQWRVTNVNGSLYWAIEDENLYVKACKHEFESMITNLIDNSIKYSSEHLKIHINARKYEEYLEIKVKDNGIGISKEHHSLIFQKFYRVNTGNVHDIKGYGLGLSYVKKILDEIEGSITVDSHLNQGCTFTILIQLEDT